MKTNLFKMLTVIVFAAIAGYNVYSSQKPEVMSDLALANVEALAKCENVSNYTGLQTYGAEKGCHCLSCCEVGATNCHCN